MFFIERYNHDDDVSFPTRAEINGRTGPSEILVVAVRIVEPSAPEKVARN